MKLGEPERITSNVRLSFKGEGPARFRLQHTADRNGQPDETSWVDVSDLAGRPPTAVRNGEIDKVLVDVIRGDVELEYHRFNADWLRLEPMVDESDAEAAKEAEVSRCSSYKIEIEPL